MSQLLCLKKCSVILTKSFYLYITFLTRVINSNTTLTCLYNVSYVLIQENEKLG